MTSGIRRTALAALVFAALALAILASAPQPVHAVQQGLCTYWTDANHSKVVGQRGQDCCGNPVNWGSTSAFVECHQEYCVWCPPPVE
ncbi:MAG TPA: hypothetical protein VKK31_12085 [Thermoanaerobaculia bacterium]|nr:hypothetical protein [Thermoanaerobaculia bacterium]